MTNEELVQKQLLFFNETVEFYSKDPKNLRAFKNNRCVYCPTETSPGCAIGRHVEDKEFLAQNEGTSVHGLFDVLPDRDLKELGRNFLQRVQRIHDAHEYWDETGLTELGKKGVREVIKLINQNYYI